MKPTKQPFSRRYATDDCGGASYPALKGRAKLIRRCAATWCPASEPSSYRVLRRSRSAVSLDQRILNNHSTLSTVIKIIAAPTQVALTFRVFGLQTSFVRVSAF